MKRYQPALLGGLFIGVLSSLPVVNVANCCCLWVITGGMLTVYLQQQARVESLETGEAVLGGLMAGVIGALIAGVVSLAVFGLAGEAMQEQLRASLDQMGGQIPPETRDMVLRLFTGPNVAIFSTLIGLCVNAVFGMLGALLGLAIFRKKTPPAAPAAPIV